LPSATDAVYTLSQSFFVTQTGVGTIGSTPVVTVDNFNFWSSNAIITAGEPLVVTSQIPYLVFPEQVWGTVRLISTTTGPAATPITAIVNSASVALTGQKDTVPGFGGGSYHADASDFAYWVKRASNDASAAGNNRGANREGTLYSFRLAATGLDVFADNSTITTSRVSLGIDAYDADGNTYRVENTFNVE